jgi:hypothetical protein
MDGRDLALRVYQARPATKVIMITGEPEPVRKFIDDFSLPWRLLSKPFKATRLLEELAEVTAS